MGCVYCVCIYVAVCACACVRACVRGCGYAPCLTRTIAAGACLNIGLTHHSKIVVMIFLILFLVPGLRGTMATAGGTCRRTGVKSTAPAHRSTMTTDWRRSRSTGSRGATPHDRSNVNKDVFFCAAGALAAALWETAWLGVSAWCSPSTAVVNDVGGLVLSRFARC